MSNNAQLLISDQGGQPETEQDWDAESKEDYVNLAVLESEYTIPVFWFTLFGPENIDHYIDPDDEINTPYLVAAVSDAKARFEYKISELRKAFSNIDSFLPAWEKTLEGIDKAYVKVQLYEILEMSEDGYELLGPALSFLGDPNDESTLAFMRLTDFPDVFDHETGTIVSRKLANGRTTNDYLLGFDPWK